MKLILPFTSRVLTAVAAALAVVFIVGSSSADPGGTRPIYRSPIDVAFSPDGALLAVADPTWGGVVFIDAGKRTVLREVRLNGDPAHVIWNGADKVLVSEGIAGTVAEVDVNAGTVTRRLSAVRRAAGLARTSDGMTLLVCDRGLGRVAFLDLKTGQTTATVDVVREPGYIALTGDNKYAVVGNKLPRSEDARLPEHGAEVSIVELGTGTVRNVRLPGGSSVVRQIAVSPDGRWAYVIHQAGRANTMVTQLDKGWVMTNCTSIIDIANASLYSTFLFDREGSGAANPWGVAVSPDGTKLWATIAGISELAAVDLKGLHTLIADDEFTRSHLHADLQTMYGAALLVRTPLSDTEGTRGVAVSPDGTTLAVASYFEGKVLFVDVASQQSQAVALDNNPAEDQVRTGERYYYSGKNCYQRWLSCATCHEAGRVDGLNWDLLNDGQGNPKNTRSHVLSAVTPPTNITGCRDNAMVSARAGYANIEFQPSTEDRVAATYAFIQSIAAEPSPYLGPDGKLTPDAVAGKKIFDSAEADCARCHTPPLFTDLRRYDVGTRLVPPDISSWDEGGYDVPTLVELWRTAPYLHLGHAATLEEVLVTFNAGDQHGKTSHLTPQERAQLVAYLLQIGPTAEDGTTQVDAGTEQTPDAGRKTTPVNPDTSPEGGCICRMGSRASGPTNAAANRTMLVGIGLLLFAVRRRRVRAQRNQKTDGQT